MRQSVKRKLVVSTVLVFVCVAVYLNWRYASQLPLDGESGEVGKVLGESTLVNGEADTTEGDETEGTETEGDYFATARLTRQQARDSALALLREASENTEAGEEAAASGAESIQVLAGYAVAEAQIENLVTAKGYADCVAFMGEDSISVVVDTGTGELTAEDVAKITDIAMTETGYPASGIKIMASN